MRVKTLFKSCRGLYVVACILVVHPIELNRFSVVGFVGGKSVRDHDFVTAIATLTSEAE